MLPDIIGLFLLLFYIFGTILPFLLGIFLYLWEE